MGTYINWDDVAGRYPNVKDVGGSDELQNDYVQYAEAEIDSRLGRMYNTPFDVSTSAIPVIKDLAIDLTYLRTRNIPTERARELREAVDDRIMKLMDGSSAIINAAGEQIGRVGDSIFVNNKDFLPVFGMHDIEDHEIDQDLIDEELDRRDITT